MVFIIITLEYYCLCFWSLYCPSLDLRVLLTMYLFRIFKLFLSVFDNGTVKPILLGRSVMAYNGSPFYLDNLHPPFQDGLCCVPLFMFILTFSSGSALLWQECSLASYKDVTGETLAKGRCLETLTFLDVHLS